MAKRRHELDEDAEQMMDAVIAEIGGERVSVVDPWRVLPELIRKPRGKPPLPRGDVYVIPEHFFQAARGSRAQRG